MHVYGAAIPRQRPPILAEGAVSDSLDEFGAGEHDGRVRGEERQQLEFLKGELDLPPVDPDAALRVVQEQPVAR